MNNPERKTISHLINQIGETDQQFLTAPTPELAERRATLRLQLAHYSHQKNEQVYFLTEAAALLELALMELEDLNALTHTRLSTCLAQIYLAFYQITHEERYLTICNQILKPLAHLNTAEILLNLARTSAAANHPALTKHWLSKLMKHHAQEVMTELLDELLQYPEFKSFKHEDWFQALLPKRH